MNSNHPKIYAVPFHPEHLKLIVLKPTEARLLDQDALNNVAHSATAAHTLMCEGRILAVIGFAMKWAGVATVFVVPSTYMKDYPIQTFRYVLKTLVSLHKIPGMRRLETMGHDAPDIDKWMTRLGFVCEGVHPHWSSQGDTFKTWARYTK